MKFFFICSFFAFVILFVVNLTISSPIDMYFGKRVEAFKNNFALINMEIDSLQSKLHAQLFPHDQFYREVLELETIPTPMRIAGTGGSDPYEVIKNSPYREIITQARLKLDMVKNQIRFQDESYKKVYKEAIIFNKELVEIPAIKPLHPDYGGYISSYFGYRSDPLRFIRKMHKGIDFAGRTNTPIYATANGKVHFTKVSSRGYGKEIVILHNFGYRTLYAHLNEILVKEGDEVKRGQLIGLMGSTGKSTGTHLHYEIQLNRRAINPLYYFADDLTGEEYNLIINQVNEEKAD